MIIAAYSQQILYERKRRVLNLLSILSKKIVTLIIRGQQCSLWKLISPSGNIWYCGQIKSY